MGFKSLFNYCFVKPQNQFLPLVSGLLQYLLASSKVKFLSIVDCVPLFLNLTILYLVSGLLTISIVIVVSPIVD